MSVRKTIKFVLGVAAAIAMLAGCGGQPQLPSGLTSTMSQSHAADSGKQGKRLDEGSPYTLVDLGTFGGPQSYVSTGNFIGPAQTLTNGGTIVGAADTSTPDPFPSYCFNTIAKPHGFLLADCYIANAFVWQNRSLTALPGLTQDSAAAFAVSNNGLVSGIAENGATDPLVPGFPELRAVLWTGQQVASLGTLRGNESLATGVNDAGQVTGNALNATPDPYSFFGLFVVPGGSSNSTETRAFQWRNNQMTDIGTLGGPDAEGAFINQRGQIMGDSYTNDVPNPDSNIPTDLPFIWTPGRGSHGMQNLGTLGGDSITTDVGLNNKGEAIGSMYLKGDTNQHPYLWNGHRLIDLGTFGGPNGDTGSINDAGEVVGWGGTTRYCPVEGGGQLPALWRQGSMTKPSMTNLGSVPGTDNGFATWINSRTQVVGFEFACDGSYDAAFLWEKGSIVDLNTLIAPSSALHLYFPVDINDRGEIAGLGTLANGDVHAFVLIPNYKNKGGGRIGATQGATVPRKVTPAEVVVFHAMLAHLHEGRIRHRHF